MKILFVAAEGAPFSKTGGLGDVIGALPKSLVKAGHEVGVILPYYDMVDKKFGDQMEDLFHFKWCDLLFYRQSILFLSWSCLW